MSGTLNDLRRLRRSREGRLVAGVCAGLGRQLRVDPVLLRVILVVLVPFGGVGALLYVAGWVLMPEQSAERSTLEEHLGKRRDGTPDKPVFVAGIVVLLVVLASIPWWGLSWHSPALLLLAALGFVALLRRQGGPADLPRPGETPPGAPGTAAADGAPAPFPWEVSATGALGRGAVTPGAVSPGGARPAARDGPGGHPPGSWRNLEPAPSSFWEHPDPLFLESTTVQVPSVEPTPTAPLPVTTPPRSRLFLATMGSAAVAIGLMGLLDAQDVVDFSRSAYVAAALGVVGAGLIAGTWSGRSRGLIPVGVILALLLIPLTFSERSSFEVSTERITPRSVEAVLPSYDYDVGEMRMDLTKVPFADDTAVSTGLDLAAGDVEIIVPRNVDVELSTTVGVGDLSLFGRGYSGLDVDRQVTDLGPDGKGGGMLRLAVDLGAGDVVVRRG